MKAYTAVQKKLLTIIYALWKNDQSFTDKAELKSGGAEQAPSLASAPQELKKLALARTRAKQDRHPSTHRRMSSLA